MRPLLELRGLTVAYGGEVAVRTASLELGTGEAVGLVGPSGSGKSTLAAALVRLLQGGGRVVAGEVLLRGEDLLRASPARMRELRGAELAYLTQDAVRSLNPTMTAGAQVVEAMTVHGRPREEAKERAAELFRLVGLAPDHRIAYAHELSGGQRQRVAIAAAVANEPVLLVADEPTTGLDVVVQRRLLDLLADLRERLGLALLLVSHDHGVVRRLCPRTLRMDAGRLGPGRLGTPLESLFTHGAGSSAAGAAPPLLELCGVGVAYRRRTGRGSAVPALREVDLTVAPGEIVGLIGRSGAGKTTLARLVLGLARPDTGEVRFDGRALHTLRRRALRRERRRMHLIFQDAYDAVPEQATTEWALTEPLRIRGERPGPSRLAAALEAAGLVPPERFLGRRTGELSGGERQRLALARALVGRPELIVADEPTSMLDPELRFELIDRMRAAREREGTTFLFISHDLALARRFCDRLIVLSEGRIVERGAVERLVAEPRAEETRELLEATAL